MVFGLARKKTKKNMRKFISYRKPSQSHLQVINNLIQASYVQIGATNAVSTSVIPHIFITIAAIHIILDIFPL